MASFSQPDGKLIDENGNALPVLASWITRIHMIVSSLQDHGSTTERPTSLLWIGRRYFDDTLGKPVYVKSVNPSVWVDATGAVV